MECGGKRSATPLWIGDRTAEQPATDLPRGRAWFHGWHGFGMGSGQPKRCRGRWPCHRSPKGTVGTGGGGKLRKSRKARNRKFLEGQAPSCPVCGSGSDSRTAQLRTCHAGGRGFTDPDLLQSRDGWGEKGWLRFSHFSVSLCGSLW